MKKTYSNFSKYKLQIDCPYFVSFPAMESSQDPFQLRKYKAGKHLMPQQFVHTEWCQARQRCVYLQSPSNTLGTCGCSRTKWCNIPLLQQNFLSKLGQQRPCAPGGLDKEKTFPYAPDPPGLAKCDILPWETGSHRVQWSSTSQPELIRRLSRESEEVSVYNYTISLSPFLKKVSASQSFRAQFYCSDRAQKYQNKAICWTKVT